MLLRRSGVLFLVFLVLWQAGIRSVLWVWFNYNRQVFAERFCVNRNKPERMCRGACYFVKLTARANSEAPERGRSVLPLPEWKEQPPWNNLSGPQGYGNFGNALTQKFFIKDFFFLSEDKPQPLSPPPENRV
ncbi:MAG: hypothetical protein N2110_08060 [Flavobacteriales bacterium]|nr:hypothetical protein [Flavobacteriales bacterium]MCX7768960.1 hypothetical protein [Flavobacteriales bacterium]MDW8410803.1 hypothetical protein [Flavobacteriales bacterium]